MNKQNSSEISGVKAEHLDLKFDYSVDLVRTEDYLFLRYYFVNVELGNEGEGNPILKRKSKETKVKLYIQLPSQHIAEELQSDVHKIEDRDGFNGRSAKTFLSRNSWLAFEAKSNKIELTQETLLNWRENFILETVDCFATKPNGDSTFREDYAVPLRKFGIDYFTKEIKRTGFELPYRMILTPIAEPSPQNTADNLTRSAGQFLFESNYYQSKFGNSLFQKPWESELRFRNIEGVESAPRLKTVAFTSPEPGQEQVKLLPAPVYRVELRDLTRLPQYDRDILSKYFKVSSLGGTTYLKYKNDNPLDKSIVAWEQDVRLARDNYVSITFRAVCVFTGLKLLVSVISQRKYKFGVSFLEERFFVTYAEPEKVYDQELVVSSLPFKRIIPKSLGVFFKPLQPKLDENEIPNVFFVCKEGEKEIGEQTLIRFDYVGIDKDGKEHPFTCAMAFIPAETYTLVEGEYKWDPQDQQNCHARNCYKGGDPIPFTRISLLNPRFECTNENCSRIRDNDEFDNAPYKFNLEKNFNENNWKGISTSLNEKLKKFVIKNWKWLNIKINGNLTFAKTEQLKDKGIISKNSSSATFKTDSILLLSRLPDKPTVVDDKYYDQEFPVRPVLLEANIRISQLDQMEGKSRLRKVGYYDKYLNSNFEIDAPGQVAYNVENYKRILFRLIKLNKKGDDYVADEIKSFFTKNYKSAGAVANPGLKITNVSVLDEVLSYNDSNNTQKAIPEYLAKSVGAESTSVEPEPVKSTSLFQALDAEILGLPLLDIIEGELPLNEIPAFDFTEKFLNSIDAVDLSDLVDPQYQRYYEGLKNRLIKLKEDLDKTRNYVKIAEKELRNETSNIGKQWLENILEECDALDKYFYQLDFIQKSEAEIEEYLKEHVFKIRDGLIQYYSLNSSNFKGFIRAIVYVKDVATSGKEVFEQKILELIDFIKDNAISTGDLVELVKISILEITFSYRTEDFTDFTDKILAINRLSELQGQADAYKLAIRQAFGEASQWSEYFLESKVNQLGSKVEEALENLIGEAQVDFDNIILRHLQFLPFIRKDYLARDLNNIRDTYTAADRLVKTYENYHTIYQNFKPSHYEALKERLKEQFDPPILIDEKYLQEVEKKLEVAANNTIKYPRNPLDISARNIPGYALLESQYDKLQIQLQTVVVKGERCFENYATRIKLVEYELSEMSNNLIGQIKKIDEEYEKAKAALQAARNNLSTIQRDINNYARIATGPEAYLKEQVKVARDRLFDIVRNVGQNDPTYQQALVEYRKLQGALKKLQQASHQKFNYRFSTKKFRKASLGGVVDFIPANTELNVDVNYEIEFDIDTGDQAPIIKRQEYSSKSKLSDFKLSLLKLIRIDFEQVSFVTGSSIKDDFDVRIRDIQFGGPLKFVQAFQEYLSNLNNNLVFDINSSHAMVGYSFSLPNFTAGYFNFFNFNLSAQIYLPFDPAKSLLLMFGFGSETSKFGITVAGVFGGQGYFNLIADPKRGIVGMVLVLEFGAIFNLDLFIAKGTAYLVGGIFIKRYHGDYELRGYILCVGSFNVLGLFSASLSFYLGLFGNGDVLTGQCVVTATKRFSRFFSVSASCRMEKRIKGAAKDSEGSKEKLKSKVNDERLTSEYSDQKFLLASREYFGSYQLV